MGIAPSVHQPGDLQGGHYYGSGELVGVYLLFVNSNAGQGRSVVRKIPVSVGCVSHVVPYFMGTRKALAVVGVSFVYRYCWGAPGTHCNFSRYIHGGNYFFYPYSEGSCYHVGIYRCAEAWSLSCEQSGGRRLC